MPRKSGPSSGFQRPLFDFSVRNYRLRLGRETKLMGVLNVTPDSFSDGGAFLDPARAEERALQMEEEGAHLIDVGGESSRPGSKPVPAPEQIRRVRPVLKRLAKRLKIPLSVDTANTDVMRVALDEGVSIVNDITALRDRRSARLVASHRAGVVLMHMQGSPARMQVKPVYRDVISDVTAALKKAVATALEAGISRESILIDPGFGFGKTTAHNTEILDRLDAFSRIGMPVLVGLSRKSFIGHLIDAPVEGRLYGSLGASALAIARGAHVLRVHDVLAHRQFLTLYDRLFSRS